MPSDVPASVIIGIVAALFSGVLVALINNAYLRGLNRAAEEKVQAEKKKVEAEAEKTRAETEEIRLRVRGHQEYIDDMSLIVTRLISTFEFFFLAELGKGSDYQFMDSYRDKDHLRRLYDLGFIDKTDKLRNIADLHRGDLLRDKLIILPAGEAYLKLRERVAQRRQDS
jgi:hypothetical protein